MFVDAPMKMSIREINGFLGESTYDHLLGLDRMIAKRFLDQPDILSNPSEVPSGIALLGWALTGEQTIDLTLFPRLSTAELNDLLVRVPMEIRRSAEDLTRLQMKTTTISLSGNKFLRMDLPFVLQIIDTYPSLRNLHLVGTWMSESELRTVRRHRPNLRVYDPFEYSKADPFDVNRSYASLPFLPAYLPNDKKPRFGSGRVPRLSQMILAVPGQDSYEYFVDNSYTHGLKIKRSGWNGTVSIYSFDELPSTTSTLQGLVRFLHYLGNRFNGLKWSNSDSDFQELTGARPRNGVVWCGAPFGTTPFRTLTGALTQSMVLTTRASSQDSTFTVNPIPGYSSRRHFWHLRATMRIESNSDVTIGPTNAVQENRVRWNGHVSCC